MAYKNTKSKNAGNPIIDMLQTLNFYEYILGALILFTVAVIPLLVGYVGDVPVSPEEIAFFRFPETWADLFSYNRSEAVKFVTIIMGIVFALDFYRSNVGKHAAEHTRLQQDEGKINPGALHRETGWLYYFKRPEVIVYIAFFAFALIAALVDNHAKFEVFGINEANSILFSIPLYFFVFSPLVFIITGKTKSNINKPIAISCLVFFAGVILTTVYTRNKYLNFHGSKERYESIYAILGYLIIFLSVIRFADSKKKVKIILIGLVFSAVVLGLVAVFQMMGKDFFATSFAAKLMYGKLYTEGETFLTPLFTTSAYSLLYNPNTLGLYASMMVSGFFFSSIFIPWRNPLKYVSITMCGLSIAALAASSSATGFISFGLTLFIGIFVIIIYCVKTQRNVVPLFIGAAVSVVIAASAILLVPNINSKISYAVGKVFTTNGTPDYQFLRNLKSDGNGVELVTSAGSIKMSYFVTLQSVEVKFNDVITEPTQTSEPDENGIIRKDYAFPGVGSFQVSYLGAAIAFNINGVGYNFYADPENNDKLYYLTTMGIPMDIDEEIPSFGFNGNENFASGRGYAWSRTIPILKSTILKGTGADSFVVTFPQYDVVGKTRYFGNPNMLWDKAHNGYLQYAVNTGVVSVLAILFLLIYYMTRGIKNIVSQDDSDRTIFSFKFGLVMAVIAYSITFFTTDSTVGVSPIFWALFGLGVAVTQLSEHLSCPADSSGDR